MKKALFLLFGIMLLFIAVHANDPPGLNMNDNVEYVYIQNADVQILSFDALQVPVLTNSYCTVSGGTRPGVVVSSYIYVEPTYNYYNVKCFEYQNYGNLRPNPGYFFNSVNLYNNLLIPPRFGLQYRSVVI